MTAPVKPLSQKQLDKIRPDHGDTLVINQHSDSFNMGWLLVNGRYLSNQEVEHLEANREFLLKTHSEQVDLINELQAKLDLYGKSGCDLVVCNEPQRCGTVQELEAERDKLREPAAKWEELSRLWALDDKEKVRHDFLIATDKDMVIINLYRRLEVSQAKIGVAESALREAQAKAQAPVDGLCCSEALEAFASIEHDQWITWAKNIMQREKLSPERCERWGKLFVPYDQLSDDMKDADRKWARLVLVKAQILAGVHKPDERHVFCTKADVKGETPK